MLLYNPVKAVYSGTMVALASGVLTAVTLPAGVNHRKCLVAAVITSTGQGLGAANGTGFDVQAGVLRIAQYNGAAQNVDYCILEMQ